MRKTRLKAMSAVLALALFACMFSTGLAFAVGSENDASETTGSQSYHPLAVFGKDNRVQVRDTNQYPYSAIALMRVHAKCGCSWEGSGFMVLPDVLMTAGHCICCVKHQQPADMIDFYFGYQSNGDYAYKYSGSWESCYGTTFPGGYTRENMEWDYGIVRFDEYVGDITGYFGMKVKSDKEFKQVPLRVAGYRDGLLKYDSGRMEAASDRLVQFQADMVAGNSGCPIYDGEIASAICVADNEGLGYNYGRRITQDVFDKALEMTNTGIAPGPIEGNVVDPNKTGKNGYVLADSDTHLYSREELSGLDDWGLAVARNEIAARRGYKFEGGDFAKYFKEKSWYKGTLSPEEFRSIVGILNRTEETNIQTILGIEIEKNSPYKPGGQILDPSETGKEGYVLPEPDTHYYTKAELSGLTDWGLAVARNEIPARHGYKFEGGDFAKYFKGKSWYKGTLSPKKFRSIVGILNEVEEANVNTILEIEEERNSPHRPQG